LLLRRNGKPIENIEELTGLSKEMPAVALCMTILLFSLAGMPPFAGFFAKLGVLQNALDGDHYGPAIVAVLASVVSAAYYLRVIKVMYFDEPMGGEHALSVDKAVPFQTLWVLGLTTMATVGYLLWPQALQAPAKQASYYLLHKAGEMPPVEE
jgi:NADH-quinone oxidoreductase subunit N